MKANPICRVCDAELNNENWSPSPRKKNEHICKKCNNKYYNMWRKANPEKVKAQTTRANRNRGMRPFNDNKECSQYLGIHIAERILSHVFKNVERMPMNNPGYDVICNHNKRIDIKSSCVQKQKKRWSFQINHNTIADFFLCIAFDNREDLTPMHAWLIPGSKLSHIENAAIYPSTIHKWDKYRLDISKVSACCDALR